MHGEASPSGCCPVLSISIIYPRVFCEGPVLYFLRHPRNISSLFLGEVQPEARGIVWSDFYVSENTWGRFINRVYVLQTSVEEGFSDSWGGCSSDGE